MQGNTNRQKGRREISEHVKKCGTEWLWMVPLPSFYINSTHPSLEFTSNGQCNKWSISGRGVKIDPFLRERIQETNAPCQVSWASAALCSLADKASVTGSSVVRAERLFWPSHRISLRRLLSLYRGKGHMCLFSHSIDVSLRCRCKRNMCLLVIFGD